jgi:ATP-dependent Clp protease adaptor protein ClpS
MRTTMSNAEAATITRTKKAIKEPPLYRVIYINDNTTTMEFVVGSLVEFFDYSVETATQLTVSIHEHGQATVAVLPFEIAEQKGTEVTDSARLNEFPLQVKLEPDSK